MRRDALKQLVVWTAIVWPFEVAVFLWPTGVVQMFTGAVDDGYDGLLAWVWLVCAITTIGLVAMTWFALRERYYSAVMAATGLLYLAILTALRHGPHPPRRPRPLTHLVLATIGDRPVAILSPKPVGRVAPGRYRSRQLPHRSVRGSDAGAV